MDAAVIVATHDPEFAAAFAQRVVLLADGAVIADGTAAEVLTGGSYFATETARILGRRRRGAAPRPTASRCCAATASGRVSAAVVVVSWQAGAFAILAVALAAGFRLV